MEMTMEKFVAYLKQLGFVYQGSEIYGGLANTWDYGPLGVELKNNLKKLWWKAFVQTSPNNVGLDSAILMNSKVWQASGHLKSFSDLLTDCRNCKARYRADKLIGEEKILGKSCDEVFELLKELKIKCPKCGSTDFTEVRHFNLMFKTSQGVVEDKKNEIYLRPETAQGIFVNFSNVLKSMRKKLPFGIAQIGKSFRNEITPGNFLFRTIEFEQMELQKFCKEEDGLKFYDDYKNRALKFIQDIGLSADKLRFHDHDKLAHYAKAACDIQYKFPIGWQELNGIHHRGTWDLSRHQEYSGKSMLYLDPFTNEKFIPTVIEYSIGADRLTLALMCEAYEEEELENGETRVVMHFHPAIAPYKVAVLPLQKNLGEKATEVSDELRKYFMVDYDEAGSIGKRYRRQDEIGTPYCITVDFQTLEDNTVTIRDRDTMEQQRIAITDLKNFLFDKITMSF